MGYPADVGTDEQKRIELGEKLDAAKKRILTYMRDETLGHPRRMNLDDVAREVVTLIDVLSEVVKRLS